MILLVLLLYVAFLCVSLSPSTSLLYSPPISLMGGGAATSLPVCYISLSRWGCFSSITHMFLLVPLHPCMLNAQFVLLTPSLFGQHLKSHTAPTFIPTRRILGASLPF